MHTFLDHLIMLVIQYVRSYVSYFLSVGISSCLPRCYPLSLFRSTSAAFPINLVSAILHVCGCVLASSSSQTLLFSRNVSTCFMCASFLMSLFLVWSLLPISTPSFQLSGFLPLRLPDSYYLLLTSAYEALSLVNSDPMYLKDVTVGRSASTLIQKSSQWLMFHV